MNNFTKVFLSWAVAVLVVVTAIFLVVSVNQKLNTATTTNTVSFNGEGKVLAKPDVAVTNASIVTQAATSKEAQDQNSKKSRSVVDFLKRNGVDEKDIKTVGYNIYPQYVYPRSVIYEPIGGPKISGYQVIENLEVKVRNLDKVSDILDGAVAAGANQIGGLVFKIDNLDKLKAEARAKAVADAKKKASELQGQIGLKLGKIVNFTEGFSGYPGPLLYEAQAVGGKGGGPAVPSGENEVTVNVTLTYQIK